MKNMNKQTQFLAMAFLGCLALTLILSSKEVMSTGSVIFGAMTLLSTAKA
jgi:hypothetical protein